MSNKLRSIFCPSPQEKIKQYEAVLERCCVDDGSCSSCIHHVPPTADLPGFVTDYGKCKLNIDVFAGKVCGLEDVKCESYSYNSWRESELRRMIRKELNAIYGTGKYDGEEK